MRHRFVVIVTVLISLLGSIPQAIAAEKESVRLNIKWYHQFQFAGYYAAQTMGYYAKEGLDVQINEPKNYRYPVETVLAGEAEYGVSAADLVHARVAGRPIVVLASIFQHSPIILLSFGDAGLRYPSDYIGRTVISVSDDGPEIMAMFLREGVDPAKIRFIETDDWINALRTGEVDGSMQYVTDQPYQLRKLGINPGIMKPIDYGIDFYADSLFTTEQEIRQHPERVAAFRRASIKGWEYAVDHVDEMIDYILTQPGVKERGLDRAFLEYEAEQTIRLIQPKLIEPGHVNPERWERMAQTYAELGMIPSDYSLDGFFYESYTASQYSKLIKILIVLALVLAGGGAGVIIWNRQLSRAVHRNISEREAGSLYLQNVLDAVTDAIFVDDADTGTIIDVNRAMCEMYGYTYDEALRVPIGELSQGEPPFDHVHALQWLDRARNQGPQTFQWLAKKKDGTLFWVEVTTRFAVFGGANRFVVAVRDISERRHAEEELRRSEETFRALAHNSADIIMRFDRQCRHLYVNPAVEKIVGILPEDFIGKTHSELGFPEDLCRLWEPAIHRVFDTGSSGRLEFQLPDNLWFDWLLMPEFDGSGAVRAVITSARDITSIKKTEEALRESERMFAGMVRNLPGFVYRCRNDHDWTMEYISEGCFEVTGYNATDFILSNKLPFNDIILPEWHDHLWYSWQQQLVTHKKFEEEYTIRTASGEIRWVWERGRGVYDSDGNLQYLEGFIADINERKIAEERLRESREQLRTLSDNLPSGYVYQVDSGKDGSIRKFTYMSAGVEKLHEVSPEDVKRDPMALYGQMHPDDALLVAAQESRCQRDLQPFRAEARMITPSGIERWVSLSSVPRRNVDGHLIWDGIAQDVSDRKRIELELVRESATLSNIIDHNPYSVQLLDRKGYTLKVNKAHTKLFGATPPPEYTVLDDPILQNLGLQQKMVNVFTGQVESFPEFCYNPHEVFPELPDNPVWLRMVAFPIMGRGNQVENVVLIHEDISLRRQAEEEKVRLQEQLAHAQKMESVGRLAGGVAHDFNNMLSVILGHSELALGRMQQADPVYDDLQEIRKAAVRSASLTRQLLAFARKQTIVPRELDLNAAIDSILEMLQRLIGETISLKWIPAESLWPVKMDPSQVDQILANLCVNARDAIENTGLVTIETGNVHVDEDYCSDYNDCVPGDYVMLAVSDDGCGMSRETQSRLFEPFFTTKEIGEGTGLGLAMIYGIVRQNNGFVNVYSEEGQGTTFRIYLPRQVTKDAAKPLRETETARVAGGRETILLVEDEPSILSMTTTMLQGLGYRVLPASEPSEALMVAGHYSEKIDLLVTDVIMPGINGKELATQLQGMFENLRVLYMSGYTANIIAQHGVLDADMCFIQKPFSMPDLATKVREALG